MTHAYDPACDCRPCTIVRGALADDDLMQQVREAQAAVERGEAGIPWRELRARAALENAPKMRRTHTPTDAHGQPAG